MSEEDPTLVMSNFKSNSLSNTSADIQIKDIVKSSQKWEEDFAAIDLCNEYQNFVDINSAYDRFEKFAEGSQGDIYYGKDRVLNRAVAIKSLKKPEEMTEDHSVGKTQNRRLFSEEAILTAQLDHPSIIPIYSLNSDSKDGLHFSMKLVKGMTLRDYFFEQVATYNLKSPVQDQEVKALQKRLEIFLKVCDAISYAHNKGIIHRDLKPSNIMIGEFNEAYVMDWGIAVIDENKEHDTQQLEASDLGLCGTPGYISPCLITGSKPSAQSDIYALGMILYEMITLDRGYEGKNSDEIMRFTKYNDLKTVKHRYKKIAIPSELKAIVEKACAYRRKDRYHTAYELSSDIRRFNINQETRALPDNLFRSVRRWISHNSSITAILFASITIIASFALSFALYQQLKTNEESHQREQTLSKYRSEVLEKAYKIDSYFVNLENLLIDTSTRMLKTVNLDDYNEAKIYSSLDFSKDETKPKGTRFSPIFRKEINPFVPGYKLAPDTELADVRPHLNFIYSFRKQFQNIMLRSQLSASRSLFTDNAAGRVIVEEALPIRFVYGGFENGVFFSYPGKGGYPEDYNHRIRPWYRQALPREGLNWGEAYYDINGHGLLLPCTFTFKGEESHQMGVIAIDVTLEYIMSNFMDIEKSENIIEAAILNKDGKVLMSSNYSVHKSNESLDDSIKAAMHSDKDVVKAIRHSKTRQITKEENNQQVVYEIGEIPSLKWFYVEKKFLKDI